MLAALPAIPLRDIPATGVRRPCSIPRFARQRHGTHVLLQGRQIAFERPCRHPRTSRRELSGEVFNCHLKPSNRSSDSLNDLLTRERIERRTAIELPKNKRNGRKQAVHLARARTVQEFDDPDGAWRNKDGAPTKADLVREYAAEHPDANHSEIARALGISRPTVIKWLKDVPKGATEPEKPKPDDLYEPYNPAMVGLRDAIRTCFEFATVDGTLVLPIEGAPSEREKRERETGKSPMVPGNRSRLTIG